MPKILKIITHPNLILRKKSAELGEKDIKSATIKRLLLDMERTMRNKDGAGLAAPQIGQNIRIIVVNDNDKTLFLINPKITKKSWAQEVGEEGCLSVLAKDGEIIYGPVKRHKKINCIYIDQTGKKQKLQAEDLLARVLQHEIDHLEGILFIDRLEKNA
ncbi:MAG: peptide deformylase [Candidatus Falkowbacteria bacterium]|nr:peptide deformylase [Candidatus Falkowbacteria bacterium]